MKCSALVWLAAACGAATSHGRSIAPLPPDHQPRLVVLLVLDQWPEWAFEQKRPAFHGGFDRLLAEGEWHVGDYESAATLTGPDHALLGTGVQPAQSGIMADEWWHRDSRLLLESVHAEDGAISAKWLRVPGLGDAVAASGRGGKAVAVSLKPRAAILPLGHHGLSIWYDSDAIAWTSFAPPAWLVEWNRAQPIEPRLHEPWTPIDPEKLAELSGVTDDQAGEVGERGLGPTFPHDPQKTAAPGKALSALPLGNDVVIETATRAIDAEQLGHHAAPDLLVISLSAHDYVGHGWGQESWEMWDLELRLDARLARFLDELDAKVGAGKWALIATGDHGASPLPERSHGGRLTERIVRDAANRAASAVLGEGNWIDDAHYPNIYLSRSMVAQPKGERVSAEKRVMDALRALPGIASVGRTADFIGHCEQRRGDARALCATFDAERSGELFYMLASGWILEDEDERTATAHGSLHDYDRLVPLIVVPPDRARHAPATAPMPERYPMTDVAPTLARWLGIAPPQSVRAVR
ncbi:MAG TPA: alkaline phosphatase family protein [Kofleriaceae bacterium]|nr:alkaline phosphatase family protein [Kofleriaceae bacterium]